MRAAAMKERPSFPLMRQTDVQSIYHMQMPRWLFSDPRYAGMSLEAKVAYTFLLNRFQLSRRNGWVNDLGEVFVVFPRKELARELENAIERFYLADSFRVSCGRNSGSSSPAERRIWSGNGQGGGIATAALL